MASEGRASSSSLVLHASQTQAWQSVSASSTERRQPVWRPVTSRARSSKRQRRLRCLPLHFYVRLHIAMVMCSWNTASWVQMYGRPRLLATNSGQPRALIALTTTSHVLAWTLSKQGLAGSPLPTKASLEDCEATSMACNADGSQVTEREAQGWYSCEQGSDVKITQSCFCFRQVVISGEGQRGRRAFLHSCRESITLPLEPNPEPCTVSAVAWDETRSDLLACSFLPREQPGSARAHDATLPLAAELRSQRGSHSGPAEGLGSGRKPPDGASTPAHSSRTASGSSSGGHQHGHSEPARGSAHTGATVVVLQVDLQHPRPVLLDSFPLQPDQALVSASAPHVYTAHADLGAAQQLTALLMTPFVGLPTSDPRLIRAILDFSAAVGRGDLRDAAQVHLPPP